ncbi:HNH endonuclease [Bacillus swezeyi]|uniref:HNH endonuclease n=1 Tax=Bacillus TaxID=1386 RepID=UPI0009489B8E|nr:MULTISPECIES: HNH endonuclease [Bacillus]AUZ30174.1 hypothetical protein C1T27_07420 [Bacillus licheniformis]MED2978224.1 HNH endonuclease [Bacillus swezeyi]NCL93516.1 hypothetical protein [Bacillus licheniformis]OKS82995.1 hypothetical protein BFN05_07805 [Bacillus licheniformis]
MSERKLTDEQISEVINLYENGSYMRELGRLFKVSNITIRNYLKANGVKLRNPREEVSRQAKTRVLDRNPFWKGGRVKLKNGYIRINLGNNKKMLEHRYIMEQHIGRKLKRTEHVHHINEIKDDNRIENLFLFKSGSDHNHYHHMKKIGKEVELRYEY